MDIKPVDIDSDLALRAAYDVERRAAVVGREHLAYYSWVEMAGMWRHDDPGEKKVLLGGWEDGRLVAVGALFASLLDNLDKCWVVVFVDPEVQGRGHGREMLEAVEAVAVEQGRTVLLAETKLPFDEATNHRYRRFAENADYSFSNVEVVRHLHLPVPVTDLERWAAHAAVKHAGYSVETYLDEVPDHLLESFVRIFGLLAVDAPTGEAEWEEEVMTPERFRDQEAALRKAGRRVWCTVAVAPDGSVAAYSTISVPPAGARTDASQWGPVVDRAHRGRRLGMATKAANLLAVQAAHPEIKRVVTQNAETNDWMVSINEEMGFEPVEASVEMIKRL